MKDEKLTRYLLKYRNHAVVLYILNNTPSYAKELSEEMNTSRPEIRTIISFLKKNGLIRVLHKSADCNGKVREYYPIILKKRKKIITGLSPPKAELALRKTKFYFSTKKGAEILSFIDPSTLFLR
jgi:DNA-binding MarR family transcriptional regulator